MADIEETTVLIIGAGPSGLALAALLGRMGVQVVILEKDTEVCEDPRGIVVNGDAVRISYQLGIGEGLTQRIGKDMGCLQFHKGNFRQPKFMTFDLMVDWAEQVVSQNIAQFQPNYEREIRAVLRDLPTVSLRIGCEALTRTEEPSTSTTLLTYTDTLASRTHTLRTTWLVGADGKRGVVRKKFLEPLGIRQVEAVWPYVGTWVAANLHITPPTPTSHPDFPLWRLGYTPEMVREAFWPSGFHFCNDSKRPAVSGRFGPKESNFWRHEFEVLPTDNLDHVDTNFWSEFGPWMRIPGAKFARQLKNTVVEFPRECIDVIRCRPFTFATKVVNRWFHTRTLLIGDAAHVFPPFGGQGIATGIRDAQGLAWRLSMLSALRTPAPTRERILTGWAQERRHGWEAATHSTKLNGSIVTLDGGFKSWLYRFAMRALWALPFGIGAYWRTRRAFIDKLVFNARTCPDGFFLADEGGGQKIAQVWVRRGAGEPVLSDEAVLRDLSRLSVLVLAGGEGDLVREALGRVIRESGVSGEIVTERDVTFLDTTRGQRLRGAAALHDVDGRREPNDRTALLLHEEQKLGQPGDLHLYHPCPPTELSSIGIETLKGYHEDAIQNRVWRGLKGVKGAKYVIVRPDFFVHSVARDLEGLGRNLQSVRAYFEG